MSKISQTGSSTPGFGYFFYHYVWMVIDVFYPPVCSGCEKPGIRWCDECNSKVQIIKAPFCQVCGTPLQRGGSCDECREHPPQFDRLRSLAVFGGPLRTALHGLKYRRDQGIAEILAAPLINIVDREAWEFDIIVPVPLSKPHLRERGYNQAEMIARPLALGLKKPCVVDAVIRSKETSSQVALSPAERYANLQDAFSANPAKLKGRNVLLLDDVATTGATLNSCSKALKDAGAKTVLCLTVAKTLRKGNVASVG